eukprot:TRINITY_DN1092_c0_g6_i3.p1 TRINITY_DN1092_c0_g6~~TRINITY_DN1092_c0_g6_i3.p1  ORF type:complete len:193 (-),score=36.34 TRINITY_DN1092_c0_g6_i3:35-613(-)
MQPRQNQGLVFKVVLVGDSSVGKSTILYSLSRDPNFSPSGPTIGASFYSKSYDIDSYPVKLQIWDTAGQEQFRALSKLYYKEASALIFVFDVTNRASLANLDNWLREAVAHAPDNTTKIVIGNKCDLQTRRVVSFEEATAYAAARGMTYVEASARDGFNIDFVFRSLATELKQQTPIAVSYTHLTLPTIYSV